MVEKMAIRFQCCVIGMAKTYASEGALEAGKFFRKSQKGRAPPFEEDMDSESILLSGEAMHKGSIIQDCNGDLEGWNDRRDFTSVVDSIAQDRQEGKLPLIQGFPGFFALTQMLGAKVRVKRCSSTVGSVAATTARRWSSRILLKTGSRLAHWKPNFRQRYLALGMRLD